LVPQFQFKLLNPRREISPQDSHSPRLFACQLLILEMAAAQQAQDSADHMEPLESRLVVEKSPSTSVSVKKQVITVIILVAFFFLRKCFGTTNS
jgi:hypothetical protein